MSEFHERGVKAGRNSAHGAYLAVASSRTSETLSVLAGKHLERYQKGASKDEWYVRRREFVLGFWDGFMDRAEEMR